MTVTFVIFLQVTHIFIIFTVKEAARPKAEEGQQNNVEKDDGEGEKKKE